MCDGELNDMCVMCITVCTVCTGFSTFVNCNAQYLLLEG